MAIIEDLKAMRIGCDHAVWAPLINDNGVDVPSWGAVMALPGIQAVNINPNASVDSAFYDDGPGEVAATLGNIEVSITKSALGPKEKAILLGKVYTANKMLVHGVADTPPWGAVGFRSLKSDGTYRYVWLYKGKFSDPADNNETKGDSINFQADELTGRFVKLNYAVNIQDTVTNKNVKKQLWKAEWDETAAPSDAIKNKIKEAWFANVVAPGKSSW